MFLILQIQLITHIVVLRRQTKTSDFGGLSTPLEEIPEDKDDRVKRPEAEEMWLDDTCPDELSALGRELRVGLAFSPATLTLPHFPPQILL